MLTKKEGEKEKCKERLIGRKEKNQRPRANVSQISVNGSIYVIGIRGNEGGGGRGIGTRHRGEGTGR